MSGDRGRLYADEDFPVPTIRHLRSLGYDVEEVRREGKDKWASRLSDQDVQELARNYRRIILTRDNDFKDIAAVNPGHYGIVICAADLDFEKLAKKIDAFLKSQKRLNGKLARIPADGRGYLIEKRHKPQKSQKGSQSTS